MPVEDDRPLAIIASTFVPERVSVRGLLSRLAPKQLGLPVSLAIKLIGLDLRRLDGLTSVPVAALLYRQFAGLAERSRVFGLDQLGLWAHSEDSYQSLRPRLLGFATGRTDVDFTDLDHDAIVWMAGGRKVDVLGDSQGGFPAVRFAEEFPELVQELILLSAPLGGTPAAELIDTTGTRCMRLGSRYVQRIRSSIRDILDTPDGPHITCISSGHDYLVPSDSAFYPDKRVRCICLSHTEPAALHEFVEFVRTWDGLLRMHVSELFLRGTAEVVRQIRRGTYPRAAEVTHQAREAA